MRTVIDAAAAYERALIRARIKAALQNKIAKGLRAGEVPYGFSADKAGRLVPCEGEQTVIAFVRRCRARGRSFRAIVAACERRGFCSQRGRPLGLTQIARIVRAATALNDT